GTGRRAGDKTRREAIAFPREGGGGEMEPSRRRRRSAEEVPAMSARESWTRRLEQRSDREKAPGTVPARTPLMNAAHRCDRCGAQAYVRVFLRSRQELLFCAHHYRRHAPALARAAVGIQDETWRLVPGE